MSLAASPSFTLRTTCRICRNATLVPFLDFGHQPLAGGFIRPEAAGTEELYPLTIAFCERCNEVQCLETVDPAVLFRDYRFLASTTRILSSHFERYAESIARRFLQAGQLVVEVGSNDGVLLVPFMKQGVRAVGVEPARNIAAVAKQRGCTVVEEFFTPAVAAEILSKHGAADAICANNVFAHIDDMHAVLEAIDGLLAQSGIFVFEVHHLLQLVEQLQYDMLYHEHLMHHSLHALEFLLDQYGLEVFSVEEIPIHQGSIRVICQRRSSAPRRPREPGVSALLTREREAGLNKLETFAGFATRVFEHRNALGGLVRKLCSEGAKIAGYGASGRATFHLNFCKLTVGEIAYIVDESPERVGRVVPGTHNPIVSPEYFRSDAPQYALLFAYNYLEEIRAKETAWLSGGGRFVHPVPTPRVLDI